MRDHEADVTLEQEVVSEETEVEVLSPKSSEVTELMEKLQETEQRMLRAQADFENFKRRSRLEKEELLKYASSKLVTGLLPVLDNFQLALTADTADAESLKKGIQMVFRQMQSVLEGEGLQALEAIGQTFDPNFHEAVMQVEQADAASGIVVEELRKGYLLQDKVIRPAMVKVSL